MEKKIKFTKPTLAKLIYAAVIAILCITAIVVGIVSAASKTQKPSEDLPPVSDENEQTPAPDSGESDEGEEEKPLSFISPLVGTVVKEHSLEIPVFSTTLGEWRVHTGIDISAEQGASVYASEDGVVSGVYNDPMLGCTVEIQHRGDVKTRYSNLSAESIEGIKVGKQIKCGDKIGSVGDTSISELADEAHLHFEVLLKGVKVNPMDYICEESKKTSLGMK